MGNVVVDDGEARGKVRVLGLLALGDRLGKRRQKGGVVGDVGQENVAGFEWIWKSRLRLLH